MKKITAIVFLAMVVFFSVNLSAAQAEEQRMSFHLAPGQMVQRHINFVFEVPVDNFKVYRLETGSPFFNRKGFWQEISQGQLARVGIYRFVAVENRNGADVNIRGDARYLSSYQTHMDQKDVSLLVEDSWKVFDLFLPPRNEEGTGRYMFSYFTAYLAGEYL